MSRHEERTGRRLSLKERRRARASSREGGGSVPEGGASDGSLVETLDRVLARGIVAQAEVVIGVAGVPLVYVGLQALVASVETAAGLVESERSSA